MENIHLTGLKPSIEIKVLLVDDEPEILKMLGGWLKRCGHAFATATNGQEAVAAFHKEIYDIVVTDINMPLTDGMQLLAHIKRHAPHTDVILTTFQAAAYGLTEAIEAGAAFFLAKPFLAKDLKGALDRVVKHRNLVRQLAMHCHHSPKGGQYAAMAAEMG